VIARPTFTGVLATLSFVISVGTFLYTMQTFAVAHRPYVGVVRYEPGPVIGPNSVSWQFVLKNTGDIPARVLIEDNRITVTAGVRTFKVPLSEERGKLALLMPGQEAMLRGAVTDTPDYNVGDILHGRSVLDVLIRVTYEPSGAIWWPRPRYGYAVQHRLTPGNPPVLTMVWGDADGSTLSGRVQDGAHASGRDPASGAVQSMNDQAILYALSTLAQTCAALAAFVGAVGLFRLQILRGQQREAEFEYRARVSQAVASDTHTLPLARVHELAKHIPQAEVEKIASVAEARRHWEEAEPYMRRTIYTLVIFEAWILFVILISLGGLAHIPALACWSWSWMALWVIAIITVLVTGVALFVWLDVRRWLRRRRA
jgi:hypothetical protein